MDARERDRWHSRLRVWLLMCGLFPATCGIQQAAFADQWWSPSETTLFQWGSGGPSEPEDPADDSIVTDRPDFTEASSTVGRGVLQIETGYTYVYDDAAPSLEAHSYPEALFRYGVLADWLELRLAWNYLHEDVGPARTEGAEDLYLGLKLGLTPQDGWLPEMALMPQMTVPTGADVFSADRVLPGVNWLYGWDVNDFLATGGSTQFNRALDGTTGNEYTEWAQSWTVGYSLTDNIGAYTEWFALIPDDADTQRTEHYFNGGFTVLFTSDIQWDIRAGVGLNEAADDYFIGTGLSVRFR